MGISRVRAVQRHKKKELEKTLKWIVYPPVVAGALLFCKPTKKRRKKKNSFKREMCNALISLKNILSENKA